MQPRQNRTFICSVLFLDIVEYSKKPVAIQIRLKDKLNTLLTGALQDVAQNDRIILDTGDGVALNFVGNPEDALFVSITLRDTLAEQAPSDAAALQLRMGINLGPVRLVKDINGRPNIIGDGINVAQRVMSFSKPGQILVSRSYHEVISCLSGSYSSLFQYEGSQTDKHVRAHELYSVTHGVSDVRSLSYDGRFDMTQPQHGMALSSAAGSASIRNPYVLGGAIAAAVLAIAVGVRMNRPAAVTDTPPATVKPLPAETTKAPPTPVERDTPEIKPTVTVAPPAPEPKDKEPAEKAKAAPPPPPGVLNIAVAPWGEVYVNGVKRGVSPPLQELALPAGSHTIELRNAAFAPHVEKITLAAGGRARIQYKFESGDK